MQEALGVVIFVVVIIAALAAVASLANRGHLYDQIGRGGLSLRDERDRAPEPAVGSAGAAAEQEAEIRQMLEAQNARRVRRGQAPLDIDDEVARLTRPQADSGLRAEIRELVLARNERRARQGKEQLDVEAEVERQLRELT